MNMGQLALRHLRYIVAAELAGAWQAYGGLGAMLTHLAHISKLPVVRNAETSYRFEGAQSQRRSGLARGRGNLDAIRAELLKMDRERASQCVSDQSAEFRERKRALDRSREKKPPRATRSARGGRRRSFSRTRPSSRKEASRRSGRRKKPAQTRLGRDFASEKKQDVKTERKFVRIFLPFIFIASRLRWK